ncbi:hypothetical protein H6P81_016332 [Aristolochia fimbriata]|uniref:Uncharacterized protein n=1 Tax=Aristolochia fimbriata TaxID=158543 RepID=A0AAV7EB83_ARIFI|nr:hypothetical protein H6P81_016332 [Aristolochia fimbriata]
MGDWRRHQRENSHHEGSNRSKNRRPPSGREGSWQPSIPSWEKKFCYSTCSIPWGKLLETKKLMCYFPNVVEWNDSAGEEAFRNAKARFWAEFHGFTCNISLPDPDMYIDEIDWNCYIDPELLNELDQPVAPSDDEERKDGKTQILSSGWDSFLFSNVPRVGSGWEGAEVPSGWGDAEEPVKATGWGDAEQMVNPSGWGDINPTGPGGVGESVLTTGWAVQNPVSSSGWGDTEDPIDPVQKFSADSVENSRNYDEWYQGVQNYGSWELCSSKVNNEDCVTTRKGGRTGVAWDPNSWNRANRNFSRYRTWKFSHDAYDYQMKENGWKNSRGRKRGNYLYEKPENEKRPLSSWQWNSVHSCLPRNHHHHHGTAEVSSRWSGKQIS